MTTTAPDPTTPEGRFLLAYGSWQHARFTAGMAQAIATPAQTLALLTHTVTWALELDQAWAQLEGSTYTQVRDEHPARAVLAALRTVRDGVGIIGAVEFGDQGPAWRPAAALDLDPIGRELYAAQLAGQHAFSSEEVLLDLWINGDWLAGGCGRQVLADAASPRWEVGEDAPHDRPDQEDTEPTDDEALDAMVMYNNGSHTPEELEAAQAKRDAYFLTLVTNQHLNRGPEENRGVVEGPLGAWYAIMRRLGDRHASPRITMGGEDPVYLFKGPYARNTVQEMAQVARILNPGHWEVVEGYRPPRGTEDEEKADQSGVGAE